MGGSASPTNIIEYVTTATTGNATDFGNLTQSRGDSGSCSDGTYGVWMGGNYGATLYNTIDYITIATTGNATDFGDILSATRNRAGASGD